MAPKTTFSDFDYSTIRGIPEQALRIALLEERLDGLSKGKDSEVLEIGLGNGDVTLLLGRKFKNVTCIDSDLNICNEVQAYLMKNNVKHVSILNCMVENATLKPLHYDHIILLNFLEHVEHPVAVLEQLSNSLSPNGLFHITVPLANSLHRHLGVAMGMISDIEEIAESDLHFGHYRVYTPEVLNRHIVSAGLAESYKQFFYLKPLPTSNLTPLSMDVHKGLFKMGKIFPEFASYIYVEASVKP